MDFNVALACIVGLIISSFLWPCSLSLPMGRANIIFKYVEPCQDGRHYPWNYTMKTSKLSRAKTKISFYIDAKEPIDEKVKLDISVAIWSNGGWKPNFYRLTVEDLCNTVKKRLKKALILIAKDSNVPATCPIKPNKLYLKDLVVNMDDYVQQAVLPYGKLKITTEIQRGKLLIACLQAFVDIVPAK